MSVDASVLPGSSTSSASRAAQRYTPMGASLSVPPHNFYEDKDELMFVLTGLNHAESRNGPTAPPPPPSAPSTPGLHQHSSSSQVPSPPNTGKSVQFDLSQPTQTPEPHSPAVTRRRRRRHHRDNDPMDSSDDSGNVTPTEASPEPRSRRRRRHRRHSVSGGERDDSQAGSALPRRDTSPSASSDTTVDLPPRFDKQGRKIPERGDDPLVDRLNDFLGEGGPGGKWLERIVGVFGGEGDDGGENRGKGRRRRR